MPDDPNGRLNTVEHIPTDQPFCAYEQKVNERCVKESFDPDEPDKKRLQIYGGLIDTYDDCRPK